MKPDRGTPCSQLNINHTIDNNLNNFYLFFIMQIIRVRGAGAGAGAGAAINTFLNIWQKPKTLIDFILS